MTKRAVSYYRCSTARQGRSGLGLDAQRDAVTHFARAEGWEIISEHTEVESGKRADRPELAAALAECRLHKAVLVIAKLDRLARNVAFVSALMESGVSFVACDMPTANRLTVHIMAAMAEWEAKAVRSTYSKEIDRVIKQSPQLHVYCSSVLGIAQALRDDLESGYLQNLSEVVHAEIFSDFLDMAQHLNDAGYKDAAAVLSGSTLESHLRELASKNSIEVRDSSGTPIKADRLNADLAKAGVYGVLDQKSVTAYLDLRNKAAHGKYEEYTKEQITNFMSGITEFIKRTSV